MIRNLLCGEGKTKKSAEMNAAQIALGGMK